MISTMMTNMMIIDRQNRSNRRMRETEKRNRQVVERTNKATTENTEVKTSNIKVAINPVTGEKIIITK